ncbi:sensor histidine kinase [Clostridium grantii]|uniref:Two-component system, sensor histidine kinase YesM n=1 Tax=Clostridium grantii DSM 8605 TaxID=1121316 RepID=A0A1M5X0N1_9CLOT|nr:histidine kinase [Clostridium grantii]SHH92994.1 two-component system, sensor histidine kinase YesM [Clostridium grantii DSM 8605]
MKIKKISLRITLYFTALLIMLALVISILNIRLYSDELSDEIDNVVIQKLNLITGKLNENINDIKIIHSSMLNDKSINAAFQKVLEETNDANILELSTLIDTHPSTSSDRKSIIALGLNGEIYNPIRSFPAFKNLTENNNDFQIMMNSKQYFRLTKPNTFPLEISNPEPYQKANITLYAQYYNYKSLKQIGYLAINFKKNILFDNITPLATETFATTYIVDENNELVFQIGEIPFEDLPSNTSKNKIIKVHDKKYSVLDECLTGYNRWHIISLFDRSLITIKTSKLNQYIYLTLFIALIIMMFISWFISQNITNPIRDMIRSMGEFEKGHWPMPLETKNEDEIKHLILGYNSMLTSFIKLTNDMIINHEESKMIEIDLIKTQIGLLEAQINPHFIHNTLNSMNYLALRSNNQELSSIIESFNKLLRMSMAINVSFVTVMQEIDNIKDYSRIQKVRFENAFNIEYFVDPNASIGKMPKLIIQPLVENSIIHGILPKDTIGNIIITVNKINSDLIIIISDDGIGIEKDILDTIIKINKKGPVTKHIGVQNVYDRLKLYYGEEIGFSIKSTIDKGTTITLKIPYED